MFKRLSVRNYIYYCIAAFSYVLHALLTSAETIYVSTFLFPFTLSFLLFGIMRIILFSTEGMSTDCL